MSEEKKVNTAGGSSIFSILLIIFVVLKLTKNIDWSWWWVISPLWIPFAGVAVIALIIMLAYMVVTLLSKEK